MALEQLTDNRYGFPIWFHKWGSKMKLQSFSSNHVEIASHLSRLYISKYMADRSLWEVSWSIRFPPKGTGVSGKILMNSGDLMYAFGLAEPVEIQRENRWLFDEYDGTAGCQGKYFRYDRYLNIPCPGTGIDGDPNISITIDEKIRNAVSSLLGIVNVRGI